MAKSNFLMIDLEDDKAKKVANVVSNDSCKKILNHLAENNATETEISKILGIPISTVHYNLQQLIDAGLVVTDEYHYSEKGKEVNHYKLANKYIIITPKKVHGLRAKLRAILPAAVLSLFAAGAIQMSSFWLKTKDTAKAAGEEMLFAMDSAAESAPRLMTATIEESEDMLMEAAPYIAEEASRNPLIQSFAVWFLLGSAFALAAYFLVGVLKKE